MRIDVIETLEALRKVRENWQSVFMADTSAQYFLSWSWLYRYLSHRKRWFILALRHSEPDAPYVAFFPVRLQTQRDDKGQFFDEIIMAGNYAADYTGFIAQPQYESLAVRGFSDFLKAQNWRQIKLDYFGGPPGRHEAMLRALQGPKVMFRNNKPRNEQNVDNTICPVINLPDTWDGYLENHMSSQTRQKLRRFLRKVEGGDDYRITLATPQTIKRDMDILFDFWRKRWQPSKGDKTEKLIAASREMLMDCFEDGDLDVPVLWHRDRPLGVLANIVDRRKRAILFYITGRDEEWTTPSPGLVLHGYCIRRAIAEGFHTYDFLRGTEPYKYMFGVEDRQINCTMFRTRDGKNLGGKLNTRSIRFVYDQAVAFYNNGKKPEAEMAFRQVLAAMPGHRGAQFGLANLQFERGQLKKAEEAYRSLLPRIETPVPVLLRIGDVELATRRYRQAAETFDQICRLARDHVEARYKRGVALIAMSRLRDASAVLTEAAAMGGRDPASGFYADKAQKALLRL
ncbi:GNAT family N-acetyltransferase [Rhizobium panacihumi]|uniref:GNAT family N-acetyltransferase n=1 Tax=Rhizobium panacihumi TaxID=2008450 RepID=UPI003D7A7E93